MAVTHTSTVTRNTPGITMIHHAPRFSACWDSVSILPQEMTSSGSPMPRKLRVDSAAMAVDTLITTMNRMDDRKLGARCRHSTRPKPPPMQRQAMT